MPVAFHQVANWISWEKQGANVATAQAELSTAATETVDLPFTKGPALLHVTIPTSPNLAPPGWCMLFLFDNDGVPSGANWVHLS
jgi:hypothetical protein